MISLTQNLSIHSSFSKNYSPVLFGLNLTSSLSENLISLGKSLAFVDISNSYHEHSHTCVSQLPFELCWAFKLMPIAEAQENKSMLGSASLSLCLLQFAATL
jgi:hypothetical protein